VGAGVCRRLGHLHCQLLAKTNTGDHRRATGNNLDSCFHYRAVFVRR
jgi:hypothetical protein